MTTPDGPTQVNDLDKRLEADRREEREQRDAAIERDADVASRISESMTDPDR
jgi:hypothetical protein